MAGKSTRVRIPLYPVPPLPVERVPEEDFCWDIKIADSGSEGASANTTRRKSYQNKKAQNAKGAEGSKKVNIVFRLFSRRSTMLMPMKRSGLDQHLHHQLQVTRYPKKHAFQTLRRFSGGVVFKVSQPF